ncbi:5-oxoprolinase subunit PxpA [Teredinibacter franksiae]|uniref:5-oxoprolinase subunit PxpA n=1 Tax=Teredinibacter franksiae TaxID=2761453 RepID=UPI001624E7BE|nr:5-oxoprolinase subunit PxpA [Teredinibacter franksiae]
MKLNCDLGEGLDQVDALVMPHIHMANIACGGHAGSTDIMKRCVSLALNYGVKVGAHPGYADRENMGRVSLKLEPAQLQASFLEQVNLLQEVCQEAGTQLSYIKPHGALYNDMMRDPELLQNIVAICAEAYPALPLVIQSSLNNDANAEIAQQYSHYLMYEGFADRRYSDEGFLIPRSEKSALLDSLEDILGQAESLSFKNGLYSENGCWLPLQVDTLCVHGDTRQAADALYSISQRLYQAQS